MTQSLQVLFLVLASAAHCGANLVVPVVLDGGGVCLPYGNRAVDIDAHDLCIQNPISKACKILQITDNWENNGPPNYSVNFYRTTAHGVALANMACLQDPLCAGFMQQRWTNILGFNQSFFNLRTAITGSGKGTPNAKHKYSCYKVEPTIPPTSSPTAPTSAPITSSPIRSPPTSADDDGLSVAAIVGIVLGSLTGLLMLNVVVSMFWPASDNNASDDTPDTTIPLVVTTLYRIAPSP